MIPLKTVLDLLALITTSSECLDGAPIMTGAGKSVYDPLIVRETDTLYLGDNALCPAAVGWISMLLGRLLDVQRPLVRVGDHGVELWELGEIAPVHEWQWRGKDWDEPDPGLIDEMKGPEPETPAMKMAAVLLFEMEKVL